MVAPMTTGSRSAPFRIPVSFARKNGLILLDQLRTLDKQRLVRRLGAVHPKTLPSRPRALARLSSRSKRPLSSVPWPETSAPLCST